MRLKRRKTFRRARLDRSSCARRLQQPPSFAPVSREGAILANNFLLLIACAVVFLGTFYPLVIDALAPNFGGEKDFIQSLKVAAFFPTASWICGIFSPQIPTDAEQN